MMCPGNLAHYASSHGRLITANGLVMDELLKRPLLAEEWRRNGELKNTFSENEKKNEE
jgi:hypothetical protein